MLVTVTPGPEISLFARRMAAEVLPPTAVGGKSIVRGVMVRI